MNNIFSFRRLGNYCLKQVNEWMRGLFLQFISIAGVYTVLMLIFRFNDGDQPYILSGGIEFIIWVSFFVFIAKISSNLSTQISTRSRLVLYLTVPASMLEKYVAHLLSVLLLYPFIFFAGIIVAQYLSELFAMLLWQYPFQPGLPLEGCFSVWMDNHHAPGIGALCAWTFHLIALFTLGATFWRNNAFIKTIAFMVLYNIVAVFIWGIAISRQEVVGIAMAMDYASVFDNEQEIIRILVLTSYIPIVVFLLVGYMRMKELEVNETKK